MKSATIYLIRNRINGNQYVGLTRFTSQERWKQHVSSARRGKRTRLYSAIRKYGPESFSVVDVASCLSLEKAVEVERAVIQSFLPEYNQTNGGEFTYGKRVPRSVVEKIIAANTGKRRSADQIAAMRLVGKMRFAADPDLRLRMANHLAEIRLLVDRQKQKEAVSRASKSRVWSLESRAKLSASRMGIKHCAETVARIAAKKRKKIECETLSTIFDSVSEAAEFTNLSINAVSRVALGKYKSAHGLVFRFC